MSEGERRFMSFRHIFDYLLAMLVSGHVQRELPETAKTVLLDMLERPETGVVPDYIKFISMRILIWSRT